MDTTTAGTIGSGPRASSEAAVPGHDLALFLVLALGVGVAGAALPARRAAGSTPSRRCAVKDLARLRRRAVVALNHAHAWLYARTDGRVGGRVGGRRVVLLTTTGRRSGRPRRTPVQVTMVGGELVAVAAAGGAPRPPAWWRNLEADPRVVVQDGARRFGARATTAHGEERARLWRELCAADGRLAGLQARARRELPVVRLVADPPPASGGGRD